MTITPSYATAGWKALGSYVSLVVADEQALASATAASRRILGEIDLACSRFRDDSDLVRANRGAGHWVRVSDLLIRAVIEAIRAAENTAGLVDPTLGSHLVALGYDRDLAEVVRRVPRPGEPRGTQVSTGSRTGSLPTGIPAAPDGWRRIGIDRPAGLLRVPAGVSLDLGATGKAFAADLIAGTVPGLTGTALIISLGGDVAIGGLDGDDPAGVSHPWRVSVAERPPDAKGTNAKGTDAESADAELVILEQGGLATSSTLARRWQHGGVAVHHLLDPRTGLPVDPVWRTVSVCASSCLEANAASTAAIVLADRAPAWLAERDLAARLVATDGSVLRVAGWPDPEQ